MIDTQKKIDQINQSLAWIKANKPEHYKQRFLQLVESRKVLKTIDEAQKNNPGIAAFGKSQVGKSYLISCLLQNKEKPFMIKAGQDEYNFVFDINPPSGEGGKVESTGVVSRFTSFKRNPGQYEKDYPVLVKTFSLADIIIILSECYFNNYANYTCLGENDIDQLCKNLSAEYSGRQDLNYPAISADDVLRMRDYFRKHINNAQSFNHFGFFNHIALIIEKVPVADYVKIFSKLWNEHKDVTRLYNVLYAALAKIGFSTRYIYLPIDAVLHGGVKENTIMSVQCLKTLLDNTATSHITRVYVKDGDKIVLKASDISKSAICAICSEVIYKIDEDFLSSSGKYDLSGIEDVSVLESINKNNIEMSLLEDNDLLDFPGARTPKQEETISQDSILLECFLRGKVSYLFNKYNEDMGINILLYCHHNGDSDVNFLYQLIRDWVKNYIGATWQERKRKLELTKVSPLFYIGTMFNLDMKLGVGDVDTEVAIDQRWTTRFNTVMNMQIFNRDSVEWMKNWTEPGEDFKNSYMLRDFKFSGEKSSHLYSGFDEIGTETDMLMAPDYYKRMRDTFIRNHYVNQYFSNPALSWDVAASKNNDGSLYILEKLNEVAKRMDNARSIQFENNSNQVMKRVLEIMSNYIIDEDDSKVLEENISQAVGIFRELDIACQHHPEFFGHMIKDLQLTEPACHEKIHRLIPTLTATIYHSTSIKDYLKIRESLDNFVGCETEDQKWDRIISVYHFKDREEAIAYFNSKGIDLDKLIRKEVLARRNSAIISDELLKLWRDSISGVKFMEHYAGSGGMDQIVLSNLVEGLIASSNQMKLREKIEVQITDYVDITNVANINEGLIADIVATAISNFVMDFGYSFLSQEQLNNARIIAKDSGLKCFDWIEQERKENYDEESITSLFNDILASEGSYTPAYFANYKQWLGYMYISFIAHVKSVDKEKLEASRRLKMIFPELVA